MKKFTRRKFNFYLALVMALCVITRVVFFMDWLKNPLRRFNEFVSLDMVTLQTYSLNFFKEPFEFSPFFIVVYVINLFVGPTNLVLTYIILQLIFSVGIVYFTALITKKLTRNYYTALLSALIVTLYSPLLLYCGVFLREVMYLLVTTISLYFLISYREKKSYIIIFSVWVGIVFGVRAAAISWALMAAIWIFIRECILYYKCHPQLKQHKFLTLLYSNYYLRTLIISYFAVAIGILSFNIIKNREIFKSFDNYDYYYKVGTKRNVSSLNVEANSKSKATDKPSLKERSKAMKVSKLSLKPYWVKTKRLLTPYFLPNNINYYFWKDRIKILPFLIGILVLYSLAVTAIICNFKRFVFRKEAVLGFYCVSFAVPFIAFVPLGRYTLIFAVPFAIYIAIFIMQLIKYSKQQKYLLVFLCLLLLSMITFLYLKVVNQRKVFARTSDYVGLLAIYEKNNQKNIQNLNKNYQLACKDFPDNLKFIYGYAQFLLKNKQSNKAKLILEKFQFNPKTKKNFDTTLLLTALCLSDKDFNKAKESLDSLNIEEVFKNNQVEDQNSLNLQFALYYDFYGDVILNIRNDELNNESRRQIALKCYQNAAICLNVKLPQHRLLKEIINKKIAKLMLKKRKIEK